MNTNFNEIIRRPDEVKKERLCQDNRSNVEKEMEEMEEAIKCSLQEHEEISKNYEDKLINEYLLETNKRRDNFKSILFDLSKLIKYDQNIKEIYEIIEPIIDAYCIQYIKNYEIDEITYNRIFKVIGTIRTDKKNIELLKTIFIS
jgi:hypothetical protein